MHNYITIDTYTGRWQEALRPMAPRCGTRVVIRDSADARELDDFRRCLARVARTLDFVEATDDPEFDLFEVVQA